MLRGVRFRISRPTTFDMRPATCKTPHAGAVWYGFGRLAHQVVRPPLGRAQRPRRRRQASSRRRRDRRPRAGPLGVRFFLFVYVAFAAACRAFGMDSAGLRTRWSALHLAAENGHVRDVGRQREGLLGRTFYPKRRTCDNGGCGCFLFITFFYYVGYGRVVCF